MPPQKGLGTSVWPKSADLERRHEPQRADQPAEVPVGLGAVGRAVELVRAPLPHGVDLHEAAEGHEHRGHREEQAGRAQGVAGPHRRPDHVVLAAAGPGNWLWWWRTTSARCAAISAAITRGQDEHVQDERRLSMTPGPGNSPPQTSAPIEPPSSGIARATP